MSISRIEEALSLLYVDNEDRAMFQAAKVELHEITTKIKQQRAQQAWAKLRFFVVCKNSIFRHELVLLLAQCLSGSTRFVKQIDHHRWHIPSSSVVNNSATDIAGTDLPHRAHERINMVSLKFGTLKRKISLTLEESMQREQELLSRVRNLTRTEHQLRAQVESLIAKLDEATIRIDDLAAEEERPPLSR